MITLADGRLILVGTSHISQESVELVKAVITTEKPSIVAVELDRARLEGLLHPRRKARPHVGMIKQLGVTGFLFLVFASWAQKQLGRFVKLQPGADMLSAVKTAKSESIPLALIDQDIQVTLTRLSQKLTWKERWQFGRDLFMGAFFPKREMKRIGIEKFDLTKVPPEEIIEKMVKQFKSTYPTLHRVLIVERNNIMAKRLSLLLQKEEITKIVAVIGAGHEKDIAQLIEKDLAKKKEKEANKL